MIRSLTQSNVVKYIYNENTKDESQKMMQALVADENLADEFIELSETKELLDNCKYNASEETLSRILEYSKSQLRESAH